MGSSGIALVSRPHIKRTLGGAGTEPAGKPRLGAGYSSRDKGIHWAIQKRPAGFYIIGAELTQFYNRQDLPQKR